VGITSDGHKPRTGRKNDHIIPQPQRARLISPQQSEGGG
jgi:hypothetical protein